MKYLVSTTKTQGVRKNDFSHADKGEILTFPTECDGESIDGGCGCRRSLVGVNTLKATTTFEVVDDDVNLVDEVLKYYRSYGDMLTHLEMMEFTDEDARIISTVANAFPVGAIVERRCNKFVERISEVKNG